MQRAIRLPVKDKWFTAVAVIVLGIGVNASGPYPRSLNPPASWTRKCLQRSDRP